MFKWTLFFTVYEQFSIFDPNRPFGPWIRTLAANLCYNYLRRAQISQVPLEDERDNRHDQDQPGPEKSLEITQENQVLYQALWHLPYNQRITLELRHFQDLSYQEMAEALNLPLNTVRSHLYRGRQKLAELLEREDYD